MSWLSKRRDRRGAARSREGGVAMGPTWIATDLEARDRVEFHLLIVALPGNTARHLRDQHGVAPIEDRRENTRLHMEAHGMPADARAVGVGRQFGTALAVRAVRDAVR